MNVNFVVLPKSTEAADYLEKRVRAAVSYLTEIYGSSKDHIERRGNTWLYNADRMEGTWRAPTWFEVGGVRYGVSQPPVPTDEKVALDEYNAVIHRKVWSQKDLRDTLMNHWGYAVDPRGRTRVWTDFVGMARCYRIETRDWVAYGNHIGSLAFFLDSPLELDHESLALFANFGWFMDNLTPFQGIERVGAAQIVDVNEAGISRPRSYESLSDLVGPRGVLPDFESVVDASRVAASNLDCLSVHTPTVYLSGGRDSRMSASLWLSGGADARVVTLGNLPREVEIAEELMRLFRKRPAFGDQQVTHEIKETTPANVTMALDDRLRNAHSLWDGDASPSNMRRNVRAPSTKTALSIGGSNGEVARSFLYGEKELVATQNGEQEALGRFTSAYKPRNVSQHILHTVKSYLDAQRYRLFTPGVEGLVGMDVFYVTQKLRRWSNQQLLSTSALLLGSHAFVRASFDLSAADRVKSWAPEKITDMAIPEWTGPSYYKATAQEAQVVTRQGLRIWLTDEDEFRNYMDHPDVWDQYLNDERMSRYLNLVESGEATRAHESWFHRAIWLDSLNAHRQRLNSRLRDAGVF